MNIRQDARANTRRIVNDIALAPNARIETSFPTGTRVLSSQVVREQQFGGLMSVLGDADRPTAWVDPRSFAQAGYRD